MDNEPQAEATEGKVQKLREEIAPLPFSREETQWRLDERKAAVLAKATEAVPKSYRGKPGDIMAAWMMADELGISRMAALRGMYVVNGKPQLSGDLLLAIARANDVRVTETLEEDADQGSAEHPHLVATCNVVLRNGEEISKVYTTADAMQAGLWGNSDPWRKYPQRMLTMRARGFALRDAIPHLLAGVYAPGEIIDITPEEA